MTDPTYVKAAIDANPIWRLAFLLSEQDNDSAPSGWGRYIWRAEGIAKAFPCILAVPPADPVDTETP
jgi:hypothetical protein